MEYSGKLFGKVGKSYFPLEATTEDFDGLKNGNELLKKKLQVAEKALNDILKTEDDGDVDGNWEYPETIASIALEKLAIIDGF